MMAHEEHRSLLFEDEEEEDPGSEFQDPNERQLVVFVVDAAPDMLLPVAAEDGKGEGEKSGETFFGAAMKCISEDLKSRIVSRESDQVSIVLYNTQKKKNVQGSEGVFVLHELQQTSAGIIRGAQSLPSRVRSEMGSSDLVAAGSRENPLFNALWVSQSILRTGPAKGCEKLIYLFTNEDDPYGNADLRLKSDMCRTTIQRAKDAVELGIRLELFAMSRPGEQFNVNIFYKELLQLEEDEVRDFPVASAQRMDDMALKMRKKTMRKRRMRKIRLRIAGQSEISLCSYALLRPAKIQKDVLLDATTSKPIKVDSAYICQDTGALITEPTKRFHSFPQSQQRVVFSPDELLEAKSEIEFAMQQPPKLEPTLLPTAAPAAAVTPSPLAAPPPAPSAADVAPSDWSDLVLLGFKPLEKLRDFHNIQPSTFLYPDDDEDTAISGSTTAFIALHTAMLNQQRFALACSLRSTPPRLVALIPQEEQEDETGFQVAPPGWQMIPLPFFDDIRPAEEYHQCKALGGAVRANEQQVAAAVAMIRRIHLKQFSVQDIQNPAIQTHYAMLQAIALEEDNIAEVIDNTLPDEKALTRSEVSAAIQAFKDSVYGEHYDEEVAAEAAAAKERSGSAKRKALLDVASAKAGGVEWAKLAEEGKLDSLPNETLKAYLRTQGLLVSGKKSELIDRVLKSLGK